MSHMTHKFYNKMSHMTHKLDEKKLKIRILFIKL